MLISLPQQAGTIQIPPGNVTSWSPREAWGVLRARVARGATCVVGISVPASTEPPPAMTAALRDHELAHAASLRVLEDRCAYVVAHYLLARSLRAVVGTSAPSWTFDAPEGGKPHLHLDNEILHASLSHTRGAVAVAIGRAAPVGVDVEAIAPIDELDRVAERVLTNRERRAVFDCVHPIARFTRLWTRKEALAKAFGSGLLAPFDKIDVLDPATPLLPPEMPGAIALRDVPCTGPHRLSVALRKSKFDLVSFEIPVALLIEDAGREAAGAPRLRTSS